ncbi:hypothetical protein MPSEU_000355500 [Mayamaea pseudoterrestris]|nr:hypothetical protein MPSEU_000355500 [Mayamaea pseudoterrestris]
MFILALCTLALALLFTPNVLGVEYETKSNLEALDGRASRFASEFTDSPVVKTNPFAALNEQCQHDCVHETDPTTRKLLDPLSSSCPQCGPKYENQHCNSCCDEGASSLHLRVHGCDNKVTFSSSEEASSDCGIVDFDMADIRFLDCDCYDALVEGELGLTEAATTCELHKSMVLAASKSYGDAYDLCLVSVSVGANGTAAANFTKPLPPVLGITQAGQDDHKPLRTYMDTTCTALDSTMPIVLPLFPGYGKYSGSCANASYIDLHYAGNAPIPSDIDHVDGVPSQGAFWIEFRDGTSTGFWPVDKERVFFNPSFAQCACIDCDVHDEVKGHPWTMSPSHAVSMSNTSLHPTRVALIDYAPVKQQPIYAFTAEPSSVWGPSPPTANSLVSSTKEPSFAPTRVASNNKSPTGRPVFASTKEPTSVPLSPPTAPPTKRPTTQFPTGLRTSVPTSPIENLTLLPTAEDTSLLTAPTMMPDCHHDHSKPPTVPPTAEVTPQGPSALIKSVRPTTTPTPAYSSTKQPTAWPTEVPTLPIEINPTNAPIHRSTKRPVRPTRLPSAYPVTLTPSISPTSHPTRWPTSSPTTNPVTGPPSASPVTSTPSASPTSHPTHWPTSLPTVVPTLPIETTEPSSSPTFGPTTKPTGPPSFPPVTLTPSASPTNHPTRWPTTSPTAKPTGPPSFPPVTLTPSASPTDHPTRWPTASPTAKLTGPPSSSPVTLKPSASPTDHPTKWPTPLPTAEPTGPPSASPTTLTPSASPTGHPTRSPTSPPTRHPTAMPSMSSSGPSQFPSDVPTKIPSPRPTKMPSKVPTKFPSRPPTKYPSKLPTTYPSRRPTKVPTKLPSRRPTKLPTKVPTMVPSRPPTKSPSNAPTTFPSRRPTKLPTKLPSHRPTKLPTTVAPTSLAPQTFPPTAETTAFVPGTPQPSQNSCSCVCPAPGTSSAPTFKGSEVPAAPTLDLDTIVPTAIPSAADSENIDNAPVSSWPTARPGKKSAVPTLAMVTPKPTVARKTSSPSKSTSNTGSPTKGQVLTKSPTKIPSVQATFKPSSAGTVDCPDFTQTACYAYASTKCSLIDSGGVFPPPACIVPGHERALTAASAGADNDLALDLLDLLRSGVISKEWVQTEKLRHQAKLDALLTA